MSRKRPSIRSFVECVTGWKKPRRKRHRQNRRDTLLFQLFDRSCCTVRPLRYRQRRIRWSRSSGRRYSYYDICKCTPFGAINNPHPNLIHAHARAHEHTPYATTRYTRADHHFLSLYFHSVYISTMGQSSARRPRFVVVHRDRNRTDGRTDRPTDQGPSQTPRYTLFNLV